MKDTDDDGVAEHQRRSVRDSPTNVQALSNGMEWGRDNAIYFSSGIAGGDLKVPATANDEYKFTRVDATCD